MPDLHQYPAPSSASFTSPSILARCLSVLQTCLFDRAEFLTQRRYLTELSMGFDGSVHVSGDKGRCQEVLGILGEHFDLEELDGAQRRSDVALRRNFDIDAARQVLWMGTSGV